MEFTSKDEIHRTAEEPQTNTNSATPYACFSTNRGHPPALTRHNHSARIYNQMIRGRWDRWGVWC
jgi:hypothetical protein